MEIRFHRRLQHDLNEALGRYYEISEALGDDFFAEFQIGLAKLGKNPRFFHFDASGLRRCNLDRFPNRLLYDIRGAKVRVWVLRHDQRNPAFGTKRFR